MRAPTGPQLRLLGALLALILLAFPVAAHAEGKALKGVALVIGQSKYEHIAALPNPANDARAMVKLLSDLGFDARSVSDRDAKKLKRDLERFVEDAEGADVALLYYSGHGIESGGENWLVPVDADVSSLDNAEDALVPLSSVMDELKGIVPVTIVLLDACRTNPFPQGALVKKTPADPGAPIGGGGLTPVRGAAAIASTNQPAADDLGTVIGFAAEPGRPALDGTVGGNSPYAAALLRHLSAMDGLEFGQVMRMVTEEVYLDTRTKQRPWVNESLRRLLYFGVPQPAPTGEDGLITGERRQLLLTISDLPDFNRAQVETTAAKDGVPLDALYGVLRALGTQRIPEDPIELGKLLDAQAERLKKMTAESDALRTDDPEVKRLADAASRAIGQGAIVTARQFLDQAVKHIEATSSDVDAAEEAVKEKRLADAAIYAQRADASSLAFDYLAAAADYRKAFELAQRWDDKLRWNYKNLEAEALHSSGATTGDRAVLEQALAAYREILDFIPNGVKDVYWARTSNNMAAVLQSIGERSADSTALEEALAMFREAMTVLEREKDDASWAAAQSNVGNILIALGERRGDAKTIGEGVAAFRAALAKQDRAKVPLDWASTENNLGIALYKLSEREAGTERLVEAEAAYRLALEEYTREAAPVQWAMVQNNLGNTLNSLAAARNDVGLYKEAAATFRAALEVRTREHLPLQWATSQMNLGSSLNNIGKLEQGTGTLEEAEQVLRDALTVFTRERSPLDWASVQNNLGSALLYIGQRNGDAAKIEQAIAAFQAALEEYTESRLPMDFAMTQYNLGNALQIGGQLGNDPAILKQAIGSYDAALRQYTRATNPRQWALTQAYLGATLQSLANHEDMLATLQRSIEARRLALEVLTRDNAPIDWANTQSGLGISLLNVSTFGNRPELLPGAMKAFESSKEVFTRETLPIQWAFAENNIGDVHWSLATRGGKAEYEQALARFESAKKAFTESGYFAVIPILDQKVALIKEAMAKP
jgi:uncharacterized caspase-like protein